MTTERLPSLPPGYAWATKPKHGAPIVRTPFGAAIAGCYGDTVVEMLESRAAAARRSLEWVKRNGADSCVPDGVAPDLWWRFASLADASIYPHLLSNVDDPVEWMLFENAGLTGGALAVYRDIARRGLCLAVGSLSDKHAVAWASFGQDPA
jgi:hypothetical protein